MAYTRRSRRPSFGFILAAVLVVASAAVGLAYLVNAGGETQPASEVVPLASRPKPRTPAANLPVVGADRVSQAKAYLLANAGEPSSVEFISVEREGRGITGSGVSGHVVVIKLREQSPFGGRVVRSAYVMFPEKNTRDSKPFEALNFSHWFSAK